MRGVAIDHEMCIGSQRIHAWFRFPKSLRGTGHPLLHGPLDRFDIAGEIDLAVKLVGSGQIAEAVEGRLDAIPEIRKTVERGGQTGAVDQEGREIVRFRRRS